MADTTIYIIDNTAGDENDQFSIQPRTFNGPGGIQTSTDLTLYGNGAPDWGERFNENFYRLLENFACPEKIGVSPPEPQTEAPAELGSGYGINNPIRGQLWYNTTDQSMYVYTGSGWATMSGAGASTIADVTGLQAALDGKVALAGDEMSGDLSINAVNGRLTVNAVTGDPWMLLKSAGGKRGLFAHDTSLDATVFRQYVDTVTDDFRQLAITPTHFEFRSSPGVSAALSKVRAPSTLAADDDQTLTTKDYVDALVTAGGGGGVISINGQSGVVALDAADVGAAPASHNHDDRYYTETEVDALLGDYYTQTAANNQFTTEAEVNALISAADAPWDYVDSGNIVFPSSGQAPVEWSHGLGTRPDLAIIVLRKVSSSGESAGDDYDNGDEVIMIDAERDGSRASLNEYHNTTVVGASIWQSWNQLRVTYKNSHGSFIATPTAWRIRFRAWNF